MFYIYISDDGDSIYPFTLTDLKFRFPNVSFPATINDSDAAMFKCYPVQPTTPPVQSGKVAKRTQPELVDGMWQERWTLVDAPPAPVPQSVEMAQARLALLYAGLLPQVDVAIDSIPDATQREAARVQWEYRTEVRRNSELVIELGTRLGLTDEQIDDLFRSAVML